MLFPVNIYNAEGKLTKTIPREELVIQEEHDFSDKPKPKPKPKKWIYIECPYCKEKVKVHGNRATCKKSTCEKLERQRRKEGKHLIKNKLKGVGV